MRLRFIPFRFIFAAALVICAPLLAAPDPGYHRVELSREFFSEGATFADLNRDGQLDAVSGPCWYEGPGFQARHEIFPAAPFDTAGYSDNFFVFAHDFNGDGWPDLLVLGFPGVDASWYENPGKDAPRRAWRRHVVFLPVDNESPAFGDLLGTGAPVLVCGAHGRYGYAQPDPKDPTRPWTFHAITPAGAWQRFTHGLGFGDINGDGRPDLLTREGWWEQPASLANDPTWELHATKFSPGGGAQMVTADLNGDGLPDVITARAAHGYGLSWFEQRREKTSGAISFLEHEILPAQPGANFRGVQFSQLHALVLADVDGDGIPDLVTGKRWWAHGSHGDPDPHGTPVIYAFVTRRGADGQVSFEPRLLDDASGVGVQLVTADVNRDGMPDFISANKRGTNLLLSQPVSPRAP